MCFFTAVPKPTRLKPGIFYESGQLLQNCTFKGTTEQNVLKPLYVMTLSYDVSLRDRMLGVLADWPRLVLSGIWNVASYGIILRRNTVNV